MYFRKGFPANHRRQLLALVILWLFVSLGATAQAGYNAPVGSIPDINMGGGYMPGQAQMDYAQMQLEKMNRDSQRRQEQMKLVASGVVSALDLQAPAKAVNEFNEAAQLLTKQKPQAAIPHLEKAIAAYPKFVSAHNSLGLAYFDLEDVEKSRGEFELAINLDDKFPGSHVNLGRLALARKEYDTATAQLEKAAALRPRDVAILSALCYAQNAAHQYHHAIETADRVHGIDDKGAANVHYVAAAAAIALKDYEIAQHELEMFVQEDSSNPLTPSARHDLEVLVKNRQGDPAAASSAGATAHPAASSTPAQPQTFPNSERLRSQLALLGDDDGEDICADCGTPPAELATIAPGAAVIPATPAAAVRSRSGAWTLRKNVDEVAVFFVVTDHGHLRNDLNENDIQIRDAGKPPEKMLQFTPQWKLPLRLGLLIDTSGSVTSRFAFEKKAAAHFVEKMLANPSDLAFVAGFSSTIRVTQDFSADHEALARGIEQLENSGGTSLFDAVSLACWKLAAYPETERAAKVLVVLTDGEDNSSHRSLRQVIQDAETTGVTIFTLSTNNSGGMATDADKILKAMAERSGGEILSGDTGTLGASLSKLRDMIRSRYLVAYRPADLKADGRYRTISITAKRGSKTFQVHARKGYHTRLDVEQVR